jgi:hypothetical protein
MAPGHRCLETRRPPHASWWACRAGRGVEMSAGRASDHQHTRSPGSVGLHPELALISRVLRIAGPAGRCLAQRADAVAWAQLRRDAPTTHASRWACRAGRGVEIPARRASDTQHRRSLGPFGPGATWNREVAVTSSLRCRLRGGYISSAQCHWSVSDSGRHDGARVTPARPWV